MAKGAVKKEEDESDDDVPLAKKKATKHDDDDDDDDDEPLAPKAKKVKKEESDDESDKRPAKAGKKGAVKKETKVKDEDSDDEGKSRSTRGTRSSNSSKRKYADDSEDEESEDSDAPIKKKGKTKATPKKESGGKSSSSKSSSKADTKKSAAKGKTSEDASGPKKKEVKAEYVYEWWKEEEPLPDGKKWRFLEHNGVIFPPEYQPHGIKMRYDGHPVSLNKEQEAIATMYAAMIRTDYASKKVFLDNFWAAFKAALGKDHVIKDMKKCDFQPIVDHLDEEREKKKTLTKEEKNKIKEAREQLEAPYVHVILDSHLEKNGNFRVEPAGLFRGRGEHPKMGQVKGVIQPEAITVNCSMEACPPRCPLPGHNWASVVHKDEATWLAFYKDTINGEFKYIFLSAGSSLKGQSDREKFEKARELKKHVDKIRKQITKGLKSSDPLQVQQNTALWLIDNLAIRAGNEKDTSEEADTVGCCSLRVEHITLAEDADGPTIFFNFLGKDSIEYKNLLKLRPADEERAREGEEDPCVSFVREGEQENFRVICKIMKGLVKEKSDDRSRKKPDDDVFDQLTTTSLNTYLKSLMPGLTAKVFRTYNASYTLDQELFKLKDHPLRKEYTKTETAQLKFYNDANYQVAILCNHSKTVSKNFDAQMDRIDSKKTEMENELKTLKKDKKSASGAEKDKINKKIEALEAKIQKTETEKQIKQKLSGVALGTSKTNYLDPRITVAWCRKFGDFPIGRIFNKSLLTKFKWALDEADEDWRF